MSTGCNPDFDLRRRAPPQFPKTALDLVISRKATPYAYAKRIKEHLDSHTDAIALHAVGHAINTAFMVLHVLENQMCGSLKHTFLTSTTEVTDDLIPLIDTLDLQEKSRHISTVHICLQRASF